MARSVQNLIKSCFRRFGLKVSWPQPQKRVEVRDRFRVAAFPVQPLAERISASGKSTTALRSSGKTSRLAPIRSLRRRDSDAPGRAAGDRQPFSTFRRSMNTRCCASCWSWPEANQQRANRDQNLPRDHLPCVNDHREINARPGKYIRRSAPTSEMIGTSVVGASSKRQSTSGSAARGLRTTTNDKRTRQDQRRPRRAEPPLSLTVSDSRNRAPDRWAIRAT